MTQRALTSHKEIQISLSKKLFKILFLIVINFSLIYYILGLTEKYGRHGIYLDGIASEYYEALYFSVVTITTLGYGDFTPLGLSRLLSATEALVGLFFVGYSIAQVLSVKQDASIEYILKSQIIQNYTGILEDIRNEKEAITDLHRINRRKKIADTKNLDLYHGHPLYPSIIALQKLNGYTQHVESIEMLSEVEDYLNRSATNIEELSSMIRKYINYLDATNKNWKTNQSRKAVIEITRCLENSLKYTKYTKYTNMNYKGQARYNTVIKKIIFDLNRKLA